jgi:outer membrane protein assembly factor BamB
MQAAAVSGRAAGLLSVAALLAACGSAPAIKPAELVKFTPTAKASVAWRASVGAADAYIFTPALDRGAVFAASAKGTVARFDAANGKQVWRVETKRKLSGGVGAEAELVVVGTQKGEVLALDPNGKPAWTAQVSSEVLSAPRLAEGVAVVRSGDGRIVGLNAKDGSRLWEYASSMPPLLLRRDSGVTLARGAVFAGLHNGRLVALALATGAVGWEAAVAQPKGANELERMVDIGAAPLVDEEQVCAVAFQGRVACFDPVKGALIWGRDASSAAALASDPGTLYLTDELGTVMALDRGSGATYWKMDKLYGRQVSAPVVVGPFVAVGDYQGYVHFLNREDGAFAARVATDGGAIMARPQRVGPNVLVQTRKGGLFAIVVK